MTMRVMLEMPSTIRRAIWNHLLPPGRGPEQAAFGFALPGDGEFATTVLRCTEWQAVPPDGFESRSTMHFELTQEMQAAAIKRAHDLSASLVEFHSHIGHYPAAFSPSDIAGFQEFVPHVRWRLKYRPYVAIVVTARGFDGFAWINGQASPNPLAGILEDHSLLEPTGLSAWS